MGTTDTQGQASNPFRLILRRESRRIKVASALILTVGMIGALLAPIDHDVAWHLYAAERLLEGARLYVDLIEYNLPPAYYLPVPVVFFAKLVGVSPALAFKLAVLGAIAGSLALCSALARAVLPSMGYSFPCFPTLAFLTVVAVGGNFGQREHLVVIFMLPYVFSVIARLAGDPPRWPTGIIIGLLGGVGASLKPFYLLIWLAVDGYLLATRGFRAWRSRVELWALALLMLATALAMLHFLPDYLPVAQMARHTLGAYNRSLAELVLIRRHCSVERSSSWRSSPSPGRSDPRRR